MTTLPDNDTGAILRDSAKTVLAIESSQPFLSVAVRTGGHEYTCDVGEGLAQAENMLPTVRDCLSKSGASLDDIDAGVYSRGPGSFTSIRVAMSFFAAMRVARNTPVCGISSLAALAHGAYSLTGCATAVACVDARGAEIYLGIYQFAEHQVRALVVDGLHRPAELPEDVIATIKTATAAGGAVLAGSGWSRYESVLTQAIGSAALSAAERSPELYALRAHASSLLALAKTFTQTGDAPVYLRTGL
ncbi:MAG: tRNA (adenosine(37)-N6)-threonylcarbamoyltransferase complex dimerization subunit type 1 TsaB [Gammaproteobacteria bacterium]|nr:tRNA (adenosine(37)-N6)-threonylcarbamoyltransferase complex dimerization subunit type 1 TsaB [Gammaproteobacteria bacterium]